jgi:hypothetical protein
MLMLMPVYQYSVLPALGGKAGFSHAYYGAIRHAVTVGFVSLMIVGVAAKVVPTLNGVDVRTLSGLWVPFVLLNAGCALRVVSQTLTDVTPSSFPAAGVSGCLEVLGLALWGMHLWSIMAGRGRRLAAETDVPPPLGPETAIGPEHRIGAVLVDEPRLLQTFLAFGFRPLANPLLRRTIAPYVTVARACRLLNVDQDQLLAALNGQRQKLRTGRYSLPVLSVN